MPVCTQRGSAAPTQATWIALRQPSARPIFQPTLGSGCSASNSTSTRSAC